MPCSPRVSSFSPEYQDRLAAQDTFGVLLVLQGLDASGKDGVIKHVMSGVNPQAVTVHAFKQPSADELNHDFLWRHQRALPGRGTIGIFNRSHYEEVLIVRVHPEMLAAERMPAAARKHGVWARRYREINDWEHYLVDNGIHVVKIMLNLSKQEQAKHKANSIGSGHAPPDKEFLAQVMSALSDAGEILIIGPAGAKTELAKYIREHHPEIGKRIVAVEPADHPTDREIVAYAKHHFKMSPPRVTTGGSTAG